MITYLIDLIGVEQFFHPCVVDALVPRGGFGLLGSYSQVVLSASGAFCRHGRGTIFSLPNLTLILQLITPLRNVRACSLVRCKLVIQCIHMS